MPGFCSRLVTVQSTTWPAPMLKGLSPNASKVLVTALTSVVQVVAVWT
jgi:hypothetical protein